MLVTIGEAHPVEDGSVQVLLYKAQAIKKKVFLRTSCYFALFILYRFLLLQIQI